MTNFPEPADDLEPQLEPVAARLLDAQVAFAMQQLRGENYHSLVLDEIEHALLEASEITLSDAVTPTMIKNVAAKYAVQVPVEGGIAELVIITDEVQENNFNDAMTIFSGMSVVKEISGVIRVY
mgnify:CR=1 FL=1